MKQLLFFSMLFLCACHTTSKKSGAATSREDWWLWSASWHPNKELLAVGGTQDTLRLFAGKDYRLSKNLFFEGTITKIQWHPTKDLLAVAMQGGKSKSSIYDLASGKRTEMEGLNDFGARAIGWNRNGKLLAVGDYAGLLMVYDEEGKLVRRIATNQKSVIGLDWHPSKDVLVAVGDRISLYDMDKDTLVHVEDRSEEVLMLCVAWHPSGAFFVTGDYGDNDHDFPALLQYWDQTGKKIRSWEGSKAEYRDLDWTDDGNMLATASECIRIWDAEGRLLSEKPSPSLLWGIDWDADGRKLVTTDKQGVILVWYKRLRRVRKVEY